MKTAVLFVVVALAASAQEPLTHPLGECEIFESINGASGRKASDLELGRNEFAIPEGDLCEQYTFGTGWDTPVTLYLGEGASKYRKLIERAVEVWNETVRIPFLGELIRISDERPENYRLTRSFWADTDEHSGQNIEDQESVIYFKPSREDETRRWGLTWVRWGTHPITFRQSLLEADVYINTHDEEERGDNYTLILTKKLVDVDASYGAYGFINKTYEIILHEIGHLVGLKHIPVSGNVMSKDFGAGGLDQWAGPMALDLFNSSSARSNKFVERHSMVSPYMRVHESYEEVLDRVEFFTENAKLGEQEKMALTCIYEY